MNLSDITPMILTHNEEANLRATLDRLNWATDILIIDSFSTDSTIEIAESFCAVRVVKRKFDHFAEQCNFGLTHIQTQWVLSLDADYKCDEAFADELRNLDPKDSGYRARFLYGVYGHPLRASLYPPRTVLYERDRSRYQRDGHAHRVFVDGSIGELRCPILHDDWKPISTWLNSQTTYAAMEADKILSSPPHQLKWKERIRRKIVIAPALMFLYCLFARGLIFDGWRGIFYTLQRSYAELVLALVLLDRGIRTRSTDNLVRTKESRTSS